MINLVAITFILLAHPLSNQKTSFVLVLWDNPSLPPIDSLIIYWRINSVISEYIRRIAK